MINLIEQLKEHEGFRDNYYYCSEGKRTIGYGRNVDDNPFSAQELKVLGREDFDLEPMTEDEAEFLLVNDVNEIKALIKPYLPWSSLCEARKGVCLNMAFNVGVSGFLRFKKMIRAMNLQCYKEAAIEMLDSKWAKQVGNRADILAEQMIKGAW
jgi:lysozyme